PPRDTHALPTRRSSDLGPFEVSNCSRRRIRLPSAIRYTVAVPLVSCALVWNRPVARVVGAAGTAAWACEPAGNVSLTVLLTNSRDRKSTRLNSSHEWTS